MGKFDANGHKRLQREGDCSDHVQEVSDGRWHRWKKRSSKESFDGIRPVAVPIPAWRRHAKLTDGLAGLLALCCPGPAAIGCSRSPHD